MRRSITAFVTVLVAVTTGTVSAFSPPRSPPYTTIHDPPTPLPTRRSRTIPPLRLFPDPQTLLPDILLSSDTTAETWRQYVPLVVSLGVITDILLGSPIANTVLAPMRRATEDSTDNDGDDPAATEAKYERNEKERVDAEAIGKAALQKARYSMELRTFLEENKTQEDKYEDMRKKIDKMAREFDEKAPPTL